MHSGNLDQSLFSHFLRFCLYRIADQVWVPPSIFDLFFHDLPYYLGLSFFSESSHYDQIDEEHV